MSEIQIRFDNGAAYEDYMGKWSQLAGERFIDWLAPAGGARWLDVGCGNGAFTEMLVARCAPSSVHGVDPSAEQLQFARQRPALAAAQLQTGDAMALPFAAASFDIAVMPLVIFFVPEPAKGVAEMRRVLAPGGLFLCLEFSRPRAWLRPFYDLYSFFVIPRLGAAVAREPAAYQYLVESIRRFPDQRGFARLMREQGLARVEWRNLSFGIAALHSGRKPESHGSRR